MPIPSLSPFRLLAAAALGFALAGCATPSANLSTAAVGAYRDTIDLTGSLAVDYQKPDGQPDRASVKFIWAQRPGRVDVEVNNPFGNTLAQISVTPASATLTQPNRQPLVAEDINALTTQALGFPLPVAGLRDWLQGYATDAQGKRFAASPASDNVVTRDGWRLRFVSWQEGTNPLRPRRIDAERGADNGGSLSIRIVLDQG